MGTKVVFVVSETQIKVLFIVRTMTAIGSHCEQIRLLFHLRGMYRQLTRQSAARTTLPFPLYSRP